MDYAKIIADVTSWIKHYANTHGIKSLIVGVSGGIDSAVVARLCEKTGILTICIAMPMDEVTDKESLRLARLLCNDTRVAFDIHPIGHIYEAYLRDSGITTRNQYYNRIRQGNLRSRIRANILYDHAAENCGIVVGTGNKDEDTIGYATKGGDLLTDANPMSDIHKSDVYKMAKLLKVPQEIIDAAPTAGLWDGQTDEEELGMTYDEVEWAIKQWDSLAKVSNTELLVARFKSLDERKSFVLHNVAKRMKNNAHKLKYPPIFKFSRNKYEHTIDSGSL